jgi:tRNA-binding EMAP/Myf-like protein
MICSASELGLPDKYDHGILPLEDIIDLKKLEKLVGTPF